MADWKDALRALHANTHEREIVLADAPTQSKTKVATWMAEVAKLALEEFAAELRRYGRAVHVAQDSAGVTLSVYELTTFSTRGDECLQYSFAARFHDDGSHHLYVETRTPYGGKAIRGETSVKGGSGDTADTLTREDVIESVLERYRTAGGLRSLASTRT